jgi:hypothetical protein
MKSQNNFSAIQLSTLGLVASLLLVGVALAAPVYRGSFTLPYDARWGQTTLPAGEFRRQSDAFLSPRFADLHSCPFDPSVVGTDDRRPAMKLGSA